MIAGRRPNLETLMHAFYMNEGILITPFHGMLLTYPATTGVDVAVYGEIFDRFVSLVRDAGVV